MRMALPMMIALGLAGPAAALELTPEQMDLLTRDLNDPESARIRDLRQSTRLDDVLCGEINWKNEQGGYEGYKRFWLDMDERKAAIDTHIAFEAFWEPMGCS